MDIDNLVIELMREAVKIAKYSINADKTSIISSYSEALLEIYKRLHVKATSMFQEELDKLEAQENHDGK